MLSSLSSRTNIGLPTTVLAICLLIIIYLGNLPLDLDEQAGLSWGLVLILVVAKQLAFFQKLIGRIFFLSIVAFISLRYTLWRTFDTLIYTNPIDFVLMTLVYFAEMQVSLVHYFSLFINLWPMKRRIAPLPKDRRLWPTVDVYIPTYTEEMEITRITATAAKQLDYPAEKLNIYILDDGSSEQRRNNPLLASAAWQRYREMQLMAEQLGVNYLTREKNEHAKAGNLNAALKQTSGELILVLDCDHVPTRDFLQNTVGWFLRDRKLFLVQTPHFFINPDPLEKRMGIFGKIPSEHEMFYRANQLALDFWNASFFCGSAAVLRRRYIEEVGGIAGQTITEDAETALGLHAKGYTSAYINQPMVCGLSPETLEGFVVQRTRWCQGMLQIGFLKNPVVFPGLDLAQRICYSCASLFWFFGLARFLLLIAPTLFILFGFQIYHASFQQVLAFAMPNLVNGLVSTDYLFAKYRWPLLSECYEGLLSIFLMPAVLGVINNPQKPTFKVTPKGQSTEEDFFSPMAGPYYALVAILLISLPIGVYKWFEYPGYRDTLLICGGWLIYNLIMSFASLGIFWERRQIRKHHRAAARGEVSVTVPGSTTSLHGKLVDLSMSGMSFQLANPANLHNGDIVILKTSDSHHDDYELSARIISNSARKGFTVYGCEFTESEQNFAHIVQMVYGDSQRWQDLWDRDGKRANILFLIYEFIVMAGKGAKFGLVGFWLLGRGQVAGKMAD